MIYCRVPWAKGLGFVLARKRRVELAPDPASWVRAALQSSSAVMAPLTHEIAQRSEALPGYPSRDPADRFLVATALVHGLVLVTADAAMQGYMPLETLW